MRRARTLSSRLQVACWLLAAACSSAPETSSSQEELCNCGQEPDLCCCNSPILIDVDGNGFELTSREDGVRVATRPGHQQTERAWTAPGSDDAWLVLDRNADGLVNDMSEMFGNTSPQGEPHEGQRKNGFLALARYDGNSDGIVDQKDPAFVSLRLWQDRSHDGISQPDELHTLLDLGVAGVSVAYAEAPRDDGNGNLFLYRASVRGLPGAPVAKEAWDVWLSGVQSTPVEEVTAARWSPDREAEPPSSLAGYWTCRGECRSEKKPCEGGGGPGNQFFAATETGTDEDETANASVQACHAGIPDPEWCTFLPELDSTECTAGSPPGVLWTCTTTCAEMRSSTPLECPDGYVGVYTTSPSQWAARENAVNGCAALASVDFCELMPEPSDTTVDSPTGEIDNVIVTCEYHASGGDGGGGGGGGGGCGG